jgi:cyanophycinase
MIADTTAPPGPIALVGAGEFLSAMADVDRDLLDRVPRIGRRPRVAVLATASADDGPGIFESWGRRGRSHFESLGCEVVVPPIRTVVDARNPDNVSQLAACDLFYLSGGSPDVLVRVYAKSPAWATITARHGQGAALAGCSAGAMALCATMLSVQDFFVGREVRWTHGLGLLPHLAVLPHFNRIPLALDAESLPLTHGVGPGSQVVGIDENVALVGGPTAWRVMGQAGGGVTLFDHAGHTRRFSLGSLVDLGV